MKISVIDYGIIDEGRTPEQALQETVLLAQQAEKLGYHRFWVAEHHNVPAFAISSPELLLAHLAAETQTIRLSTGGIMALHYNAFKLAETVATLTTLAPHRLAIGWGNSLSTSLVSEALQSRYRSEEFEQVLADVAGYLTTAQAPFANPRLSRLPQAFTLGMGGGSAEVAGRQGLGYVLGLFPYLFQEPYGLIKEAFARYRESFSPSVFMNQPYTALALFVVVADTEAMAERLAHATSVWLLGKENFSEFRFFPSPETADRYAISPEDKEKIAKQRERLIVGTPDMVAARVQDLAQAGQVDEVVLVPVVSGFANRSRTLELLKELI